MKQLILFITIFFFSTTGYSQNVESILTQVEENNTILKALLKKADAEKIVNQTQIYLKNPEIEFHYLWGNPSAIGDRQDLSVLQSFDFPTAYLHRNQIAKIENIQAEMEYLKQKKEILLETRLLLYNLIYVNAMKTELNRRLSHASEIAGAYKSLFYAGETNILEYRKTQLNFLNANKKLEATEIERVSLLAELKGLNGGAFIDFIDSTFLPVNIPTDFEVWYALAEEKNPLLNWLKQEFELSQEQVKLNKALSLPKLETGYMSEKVMDEKFQGIMLGLSIPLWERKNTVKFARAKSEAVASETKAAQLQFYSHLKTLHTKAVGLKKNIISYRTQLSSLDHTNLLQKALNAGEISLIEYIMELAIYYDSVNEILLLEHEMNKTVAQLNRFM